MITYSDVLSLFFLRQTMWYITPQLYHIILLYVYRVVYPMRTGYGALATLRLSPYCLTGRYDIAQDQCVNNP